MKRTIYVGIIVALTTILASCSKEDLRQPHSTTESTRAKTLAEEQEQAFARALSLSVSADKELRSLLKEQALKQFDNNNDVLYHQIKDLQLPHGKTVREVLLDHWSGGEEKFREMEYNLPLLNIYLPDLSLFGQASDTAWDTETPEVGIAVREKGKDYAQLFVGGKLVSQIEAGEIPAIPTLVVNMNKRVKLAASARAFNGEVRYTYQFLDPVFDGTRRSQARNAYVWEEDETDAVDASRFNWQTREILESVRRGNPGGQRASIYYPSGADLDHSVNEQLLRFRITKEAYWLITDADIDPHIEEGQRFVTYAQRDASIDELIARCWTSGNFTFVFEVHTPMRSGGTDVTRLVFNVTPKQLFMMNPDRERRHPTWFRKTRYTYRLHPAFLSPRWVYPAQLVSSSTTRIAGSWDVSEQALSKKIFISEFDESQTITRTEANSSEFLSGADASADLSVGIAKIKAGGKAENKTSRSTTYTITTQAKSDDLGTLSIFFYDPIIVSAEGGKYELFNVSNGTVTATFTPVKTSRY